MGIVRTRETRMAELEEFRRMLIECAGVYRIPKGEEADDEQLRMETKIEEEDQEEEEKLVCVTSGISFLGLAIVNRLLDRGYSVRIAVDNEEDLEKLREMEMFVEVRGGSNNNNSNGNGNRVTAVTAKMTDLGSLCEAFRGCRGVFHTSAFADPAGVSGYSKYMAELEMKASENVMEACRRTESVRKCVFTSSLLACIWRDTSIHDLPHILDHNCWSEESICRDKKLWYALGKTMAEKAAWRVAEESEVKLVTICPALVTGPEFCHRNPTASVAYLKGAQEMYAEGLLATTDINRVADAHVRIYQAMRRRASGRYICFDHVMGRAEEVEELARNVGMLPVNIIGSSNVNTPSDLEPCPRFKLCNRKLSTLMSRRLHCS